MTHHTSIGPFRYHIPDSAPFYETRMSLLWLAEALDVNHRPLGEKVVLKVARLKEEQFSLANQRAIDNEERWLRKLHHPGIIKLRPIAEEGGSRPGPMIYRARSSLPGNPWFVVTDYLPGGTLLQLVEERKQLGAAMAVQIAHRLAVTLAYCHTQGCVHRDFKPQNVLFAQKPVGGQLTAQSQPILIDFGIANQQGEQQLIAGTRPWLPPECEKALQTGEKLPAAPSMDIYAWGLTLYFMVTGSRPPAPAEQPAQLTIGPALLPDLPARQRAKVGAILNQIIQQSIAIDPAGRPGAQQLASALDQLRQQVAPPTTRGAKWVMPGRFLGNRWAWVGGAGVAALLGLAVIYAPGRAPRPTPTVVAVAAPAATAPTIGVAVTTQTATASAATLPPPTPTPVIAPTATGQGANGAATAAPATSTTAAPTASATPTAIASSTLAPTRTPLPTATATPTAPATATPSPTPVLPAARATAVAPAIAANPTLVLLEPLGDVLSGRQTFRWQTDVVLAPNQAFELIMWAVGADPLSNGFGPFGITSETTVTGDLNAFVSVTGSQYLVNGRDYFWGIRLVERDPYRPLQYLGGAQQFRFQETGSNSNRDDSPLPPREDSGQSGP